MFTDDLKRYMSVWIYIPLILSLRPEYSYWDQNLPFSSLSDETKRHPLLSHTACVPFPRIVICLWGLNLYQVTFYQRVFLWNLIEFSPHGDIPIYLFVLLLNTRNNLLYSTKFNVNQWLWSFLIYLSIIAFQILLGYKQKIWGGIWCFKGMVTACIWCFAPNCTASICEYRTPHNTPQCNSDSLQTTLVHEFADCDPKQYVQSRHSGQGWDNNAFL